MGLSFILLSALAAHAQVQPGQPELDQWFPLPAQGISGAAATALANRALLVSDRNDERQVYDYNFIDGTITPLPFTAVARDEITDLEGLTRRPNGTYFMIASLSRNQMGQLPDKRLRLGSFTLIDDGAGNVSVQGYVFRGTDSLRSAIIALLPDGVRDAADLNLPEQGGLNVEALAFVPQGATPMEISADALLIGLRGPVSENRRAFYFYLLNADSYLQRVDDTPELRGPYEVDLNGQGFRDATILRTQTGDTRLLILAGNVGGPRDPHAFLFDTQNPSSAPEPMPLPPNSERRAIEGAAVLSVLAVGDVEPVERLTLYEDSAPSNAVVTALP